jgi:hypothetical protein
MEQQKQYLAPLFDDLGGASFIKARLRFFFERWFLSIRNILEWIPRGLGFKLLFLPPASARYFLCLHHTPQSQP